MKNLKAKLISTILAASTAFAVSANAAEGDPRVKVTVADDNKSAVVTLENVGQIVATQFALKTNVSADGVKVDDYALVSPGIDAFTTFYIDSLTPLSVENGSVKVAEISSDAGVRVDDSLTELVLVDRSFRSTRYSDVEVVISDVLDITPSLGWDGENFTIDFVYGDNAGEAIRVYAEGDEEGAYKQAAVAEGMKGAAFATSNTNRRYQAKRVKNGVESNSATAPVSIYSLVMNAINDFGFDGAINADQLVKVNEVLKNGGIFIDGEGNLTAEAQIVMTRVDETTFALTDKAKKAGLAFTDGTVVEGAEGYDTVKVDPDTGMATLVNSEDGAESAAIYLESVEFVLDVDAEFAADETVSGELDFVEEV